MHQVMTGWIEAADAREACEQAMAEQMMGRGAAQPAEAWSLAMRLQAWLEPVNRRLGLGGARAGH